jgi:hypothetical protein
MCFIHRSNDIKIFLAALILAARVTRAIRQRKNPPEIASLAHFSFDRMVTRCASRAQKYFFESRAHAKTARAI